MNDLYRKITGTILAALLVCNVLPIELLAAEPIETVQEEVLQDETLQEEDMQDEDLEILEYADLFPDNWDADSLLYGYLEQEMGAGLSGEYGTLTYGEGAETYASDLLRDRLSVVEKAMYDLLKQNALGITRGTSLETEVYLQTSQVLGKTSWTAEELGIEAIAEGGVITEEAVQAALALLDYDPANVIRAVMRDCPYEFFWAENYYLYEKEAARYGIREQDGTFVLVLQTLQVHIPVSANYRDLNGKTHKVLRNGSTETYYTTVDIQKITLPQQAAANAKAIVEQAKRYTDLQKLQYYKEQICALNTYNLEAAGKGGSYSNRDPWQLIYVFDKDPATNVVCEGYAKAFQYLCELTEFSSSEIYAYSVSGDLYQGSRNLGGHMWNIIHMNDDCNYLVDLTNVDTEPQRDWLYLASPAEGSVDSRYTIRSGSSEFSYVYSDETNRLYTVEELTLTMESGYEPDKATASVEYRAHVQTYGNQASVMDGAVSGTYGESKRLEGIWIDLHTDADLGIRYTTHVQTYGWLDPVANGEMSGTSGESKRLEALMIELYGKDAEKFDVYYRVHAQTYGWLGWAKNGEPSGTAGYSKRLEALQIVVVPRGTFDPADYADVQGTVYSGNKAYVSASSSIPTIGSMPRLSYRTHVQTYGWQKNVTDGKVSGTSGESKRLEAIEIRLKDPEISGGVRYTTHVQTYGWLDPVEDGAMSGTSGESKRLEAIRIELTGQAAEEYDIYYRVHAQRFGWLNWASNGQDAGTAGFGFRLEAIQIMLVEKGAPAPGAVGGIASVRSESFLKQ